MAKSGKIEISGDISLPDGTVVVIVMPKGSQTETSSGPTSSLLLSLREGLNLGGGPYLDRESFYGESGRPN